MSCCCNNLYYGLPCCCPLYTTTSTTFEPCEDAIICDAAYVTDCVIYNGPTVTFNCLTINPGDDYTEILQGIISNLIQCTTTTTVPPTTTTSTTSTTTTTIAPEAFKCADCILDFDTVSQNAIGVLSVGNLISTAVSPCTIGDYVIDWYLDSVSNPIEFTSGIGSDPAIDQLHPFTGTAARPSVAGNWIPVIRYVFLNGTKYTSAYTPGGGNVYSPDLATCLEPVVVENLSCTNGYTPGLYSHTIQYQAVIQNPADAVRTFLFDLGNAINYFAWNFEGYNVSDRIQFYYISGLTETLIGDYVIGTDAGSTNFTGPIKIIGFQGLFKEVFDMSGYTYVTGDKVKVKITSSYANPSNQNTNWKFQCKCLDAFDCTWIKQAGVEPCNLQPTMTFDSSSCRYIVNYNYITDTSANSSSSIAQYLAYNTGFTDSPCAPSLPGYSHAQYFNIGQKCSQRAGPGSGNCQDGQLRTVTKVGSVYTISFTDNADYLSFKSNYTTSHATAMASGGGYSTDPTNIDHYKFLSTYLPFDSGLLGCGDNVTYNYINHHVTSPYTFDDIALTFEVDVTNVTNSLTISCPCADIDLVIVVVASTISQPDFTQQTTVKTSYQTYELWWSIDTFAETQVSRFNRWYHLLPYTISNYVCTESDGWNVNTISIPAAVTQIQYYENFIYVTITDINDPINNFKIESTVDPITGLIGAPIIQYEIQNGVVTTPASGCTTTTTAGP